MQVVVALKQGLLDPGRAVAKQRLAPEQITQQVGVENQQFGARRSSLVFPG